MRSKHKNKRRAFLWRALAAALALSASGLVRAEPTEITVAMQSGIGYLPLLIMQDKKLVEMHAKRNGLGDVNVKWLTIASGAAMNEALLAGKVHFAAGGLAPLILIWAETRGTEDVKGVAALCTMPIYLNTSNPNIKSVRDFSEKDRIALPAPKVSIQAVTLQMAVAQAFGEANFAKLDHLTVGKTHPAAHKALLEGTDGITAHFGSPPFQYQQLKNPKIHTVTTSYDVLNGVSSFNLVWATKKFHDENPKTFAAFFAALKDAMALINSDPRAATEIYLRVSKDKTPAPEIEALLGDMLVQFTTTPKGSWRYSNFMKRVGTIDQSPTSWKDLFFETVHEEFGS